MDRLLRCKLKITIELLSGWLIVKLHVQHQKQCCKYDFPETGQIASCGAEAPQDLLLGGVLQYRGRLDDAARGDASKRTPELLNAMQQQKSNDQTQLRCYNG